MKLFSALFLVFVLSYTTFAQNGSSTALSYPQLDSLVEAEDFNGDYSKVISYLQFAKSKAEKEFGNQDSVYAAYTANLGYYYMEVGQYGQAEKLYMEAMQIEAKVLGKESSTYAESINYLATLYQYMGQFDRALPLFKEAVRIVGKNNGTTSGEYGIFLNNLAVLYESMGNYDEALPLALEGQRLAAKNLGTMNPNYSTYLSNVANLYCYMGQFELALPLYLESKNILAKTVGAEHPEYATILTNIALVYKDLNQFEKALPLYDEASKIEAKTLGTNHPQYANSLSNLAGLHLTMRNYELALPLYKKAIDIYANTLGKNHLHYANSVKNLSSVYIKMKQYDLALPLMLQTVQIVESYGRDFAHYPPFSNQLADLYFKLEKFDLSFATALIALNSSTSLNLSPSVSESWADSIRLATFSSNTQINTTISSLDIIYALEKKDPQKQLIIADLVTSLLVNVRNSQSGSNDKLRILDRSSDWMLKSLTILDRKTQANKAFELAEQNKSVLLLDASKAESAQQIGDLPDSLVSKEKEFLKKRDYIQAKLAEKRSGEEKEELNSALNQVNQNLQEFIKNIELKYPKYAALKYKHIEAKVADIQNLLDDKTALIEYVIGYTQVYIFYIDKNNFKWISEPVTASELSSKISLLHNVLSSYQLLTKKTNESYRLYTEQAHWFYSKLIAPALKESSPNIKHLIIVPDGELGHLPFETFLVTAAAQTPTPYAELHYLLNDFSITYNYSATLWKQNKENKKPVNNGQILAMAANYELYLDSTQQDLRLPSYQVLRKNLIPLPSAREEVEVLSKEYSGLFVFDKEASEKTFKEKAGDYAIIHLAMHGTLDDKHPILSSMAFSEDGDSLENNFLQAFEISKMKLNADLVILSACETGFGKFEKGNGIASLAMSFMYAGASSLMVSLWQVNDFATSEMMQLFYKNLADGMSKDEALRQAKLTFISIGGEIAAHPAFWSPFILIGDESPINLGKQGANNWWWLGLGALVLGGGLFALRKKEKQ